eukprot:366353-Chlamydomonas_euryale.AAC.1
MPVPYNWTLQMYNPGYTLGDDVSMWNMWNMKACSKAAQAQILMCSSVADGCIPPFAALC